MNRGDRAIPALVCVVACLLAVTVMVPTASAGPSPDPIVVGVELSPDVTTTSLVTTDQGGYLSLFGPDGTMYALTVPPDAVLSDLDMTMTLVTSVTGSPLGEELVGAVDIGPAGLELLQPAMLTITPAAPLPVAQEGPFTSRADGADFHMTPLMADPSTLTIPIFHLTVFGVVKSDQQHRADTAGRTATDAAAQLAQEWTLELQKAREAGGTWDPKHVIDIFDRYRDTVVVPLMAAAEADSTLFSEALRRWLSWERERQLLGIGDPAMDPEILDSFRRAFANYVAHTKERCYTHDFGVVIDWLRLVRMDALMGGILGLADTEAASFLHDCLTFTLEMDSRVTSNVNTCIVVDGSVKSDLRLRASVVMHYDDPGPWSRADAVGDRHLSRGVPHRQGGSGRDRLDPQRDRVRRPEGADGTRLEARAQRDRQGRGDHGGAAAPARHRAAWRPGTLLQGDRGTPRC